MIESSIQQNGTMELRLNFPIALIILPKKIVVVENIFSQKSFRVSLRGIKELEFNVV